MVSRKRLDLYTRCQRFLQGLPETILTELLYRYDIDLDDDDIIEFDDLLEKALVLIRCRKRLADFIEEKESTWTFTNPRKNQTTAQVDYHSVPPIVLPPIPTATNIAEPLTYTARDLTPPTKFQTVQGAIQGDMPVIRIHTSQAEEVKAGEVSLVNDDCVLASDPTEDFYEDLGALFTNLKPGDKEVVLSVFLVDSVGIVEPIDNQKKAGYQS